MAVLTAAHVIGGLFPWPTDQTDVVGYGDLHHDAAHDTATAPLPAMTSALGRLERSVPPGMVHSCLVDAAIARVVMGRTLGNAVTERPVSGVRDIRDVLDSDIRVHMLGARSKQRSGTLHTAIVADTIRIAKRPLCFLPERLSNLRRRGSVRRVGRLGQRRG